MPRIHAPLRTQNETGEGEESMTTRFRTLWRTIGRLLATDRSLIGADLDYHYVRELWWISRFGPHVSREAILYSARETTGSSRAARRAGIERQAPRSNVRIWKTELAAGVSSHKFI